MLSENEEQLLKSKEPLFSRWQLLSITGEGSSGTVYEITDNTGNKGALKVIPVSLEDMCFLSTPSNSKNTTTAAISYLDEMTSEIMAEIKVMETLKNKEGIVGYEEYGILEDNSQNPSFRLILIRMKLMQPLNKVLRLQESDFSKDEVLQLGMDLLSALIECKKQNIVHRDIKPANVFVTPEGRYLLGDFGSAKILERTMMASHKGTLAYMAPEIAAGQSFNSTVDLYSLGLLMYQLLNHHRLPFLEEDFKFSDMEAATEKRLRGVPLPPPLQADKALGAIICKMCAFSPKDRFSSAKECKAALEEYIRFAKKGMICEEKTTVSKKKALKKPSFGELIFAFVFLFACMTLFLCLKFKNTQETLPMAGISSGNAFSSGMIAGDEAWLYASQDVAGERGYKISRNTGEKTVLCDYIMHDINLTNDYIIFSSRYTLDTQNNTFISGLFRMDTNGEHFTCLDNDDITNPVVYDDYVYYIKQTATGNLLCRMPVKGGTCETLNTYDKYTYYFYVYNNKIYVYDKELKKLICTELDGTNSKIVIDHSLSRFCIQNGKVYFVLSNLEALNTIYICDLKHFDTPVDIHSNKVTQVETPYEILELNVSEDNIYFLILPGDSSSQGIWCVREDGSNLQQLHTGAATNLQIVNDRIYFYEDKKVYQMALDGSNFTQAEDISIFYGME